MLILSSLSACLLLAKAPPAVRRQTDPGEPVHVAVGVDVACAVYESGYIGCSRNIKDVPNDGVYLTLDAGDGWCAVRFDGTLNCFGENVTSPPLDLDPHYVAVGLGAGYRGCALDEEGAVVCWGEESFVQRAPQRTDCVGLSVGEYIACVVDATGEPYCWAEEPHDVEDLPDGTFVSVAVADDVACAVADDGAITCWGDGGQTDLLAAPDGDFVEIVGGWYHFCARGADGLVQCWGDDTYGQAEPTLDTFVQIDAGMSSTCGVTSGGEVVCWGEVDAVDL